ncbi:MAG: hypothetical protein H7243_01660, partial [Sphingomonadaceae bacterium]|nr:hypothetical protein [Sphingomonadaceae bacterium]
AIVVHAVLVVILAVTGTFEALAILAGLASTFLYSMACAAAWRLSARGVGAGAGGVGAGARGVGAGAGGVGAGAGGEITRSPLIPLAAIVGVAAMIAIAVQAKPDELFGLAAAVAIALGIYSGRRLFGNSGQ